MSSNEAMTEYRVCQYASAIGYLHTKFTPAGQRGWPDRLFINPNGIHVYIEFKRVGKKLRPLQEHRRQQLRERKCYVYGPIESIDAGQRILELHANETRMDAPRVPAFSY